MRSFVLILVALFAFPSSASAQHSQPRRDPHEIKTDVNSDAKTEETKQLIARARERQNGIDRHNSDLWGRWVYAVCLGCGWTPKNVRIVHTNPVRVLAGIPAAEDDARDRSASIFRPEVDIEPLPTHEVEQQSPPRRERIASTTPW